MAQNQNAIHANVFSELFASPKVREEILNIISITYVETWSTPTAPLG
jgi:hypothetical protein